MDKTNELINQMRQKLNRGDRHFGKNQVRELVAVFESNIEIEADNAAALRKTLKKCVSELERCDDYGVPGLHAIIYESHELLEGK